jgi:hypothetical protein
MAGAEARMNDAAEAIGTGDLDGYVDASVSMSMAKMQMNLAAKLLRFEDEVAQSTISLLA